MEQGGQGFRVGEGRRPYRRGCEQVSHHVFSIADAARETRRWGKGTGFVDAPLDLSPTFRRPNPDFGVTGGAATPVDLATEPDFQVGRLWVRPSAARVEADGRIERLAPRVMQVLVVLARRRGETVTRDQLVAACWGGRIVSDDAVNRTIAQVRALARGFAPPPFGLETVSKVGFRLTVEEGQAEAALGSPAAAARAAGPRGRGRSVALVAAAMAIVATLAAAAYVVLSPGDGQNGRVEIVRFQLRREDPGLARMSADMGEALVRSLSRSGIDAVPQAAERAEGGRGAEPEFRIAGSVDRDGEDVVVNTQILDRRSGLVLLSARLARPATDAAGLAEKTGVGMAAVMDCLLEDRRQSRRRFSPQVTALYLNTCDSIAREPRPQRMLEAARRLTKAAPDLAVGQALLAVALAAVANDPQRPPGEADALRAEARRVAEHALKLDPRTPKAHLALAISYPRGQAYAEREAHLERAHQIDPNLNPGRIEYLRLLQDVGRVREARGVAEQLLDSGDPRTSVYVLYPAAILAAQTGDLHDARMLARQAGLQDPGFGRHVAGQIDLWWAPPAEGLAAWRARAAAPNPSPLGRCATDYLGRLAKGGVLRGLPPACEGLAPDQQARLLAREGDVDGAFAAVAVARRQDFSPSLLFYPEFAAVRADPRFMDLARDLGLVGYWQATGHWPDFCAPPGPGYDCRQRAAGR